MFNDNKLKSYKERGFTDYFERRTREKKLPQITGFDVESFIQEIPGSKLSGGIIKSIDGKLIINLNTGHITYNDGITETTVI